MIMDGIFALGKPELEGQKIKDVIIGLSIIAVQLENGAIGSSYVLREELEGGCCLFSKGQGLISMDALEMATWAVTDKNVVKRALGIAALNAGAGAHLDKTGNKQEFDYLSEVKEADTVGMIGHIGPIIRSLHGKTKDFIIFDKGKKGNDICADELQKQKLPTCDIIFVSGTTFINNTIDEVLSRCHNAREIIVIGSSTLLYPAAYKDEKITIIAGALWDKSKKEKIFKTISLAGGIHNLSPYMEKIAIKVQDCRPAQG